MWDRTSKYKVLTGVSALLVVGTAITAVALSRWVGKTAAYVGTNLVYWGLFCLPCVFWLTKNEQCGVGVLYQRGVPGSLGYTALAFLPVVAVGAIAFLPMLEHSPPAGALWWAAGYALMNATVEELFWRGMYLRYSENNRKGWLVSAVLFTCWHLSLLLVGGMEYQGGALALVGGAAFMGALWSVVVFKTKTIRYTAIAHVLVNFFAFGPMIYSNWYS